MLETLSDLFVNSRCAKGNVTSVPFHLHSHKEITTMKIFNSTLRITLTAIGLSLAAVSAYLTATYLYDIGKVNGYGYIFASAGVLLDMAKTVFPVACIMALAGNSNNKLVALSGLGLAIAMMFTSYTLSVSAITKSAHEIRTEALATSIEQSSKYQNITTALKPLELELAKLQKQQSDLWDISYKKQARSLQPKISDLTQKISDLYLERGTMPPQNTTIEAFDSTSIKILAGLIEVVASISLVLSTSIRSGQPTSNLVAEQRAQIPQVEETDTVTPDAKDSDQAQSVEMAEANVPDVLCVAAKNALLGGIRPSERALQDALSITRKRAGDILNFLENDGFIVRDGRNHRQLSEAS